MWRQTIHGGSVPFFLKQWSILLRNSRCTQALSQSTFGYAKSCLKVFEPLCSQLQGSHIDQSVMTKVSQNTHLFSQTMCLGHLHNNNIKNLYGLLRDKTSMSSAKDTWSAIQKPQCFNRMTNCIHFDLFLPNHFEAWHKHCTGILF